VADKNMINGRRKYWLSLSLPSSTSLLYDNTSETLAEDGNLFLM
jgi:hypothetical protein